MEINTLRAGWKQRKGRPATESDVLRVVCKSWGAMAQGRTGWCPLHHVSNSFDRIIRRTHHVQMAEPCRCYEVAVLLRSSESSTLGLTHTALLLGAT